MFLEFLGIISLLKITKRVAFLRKTCGADVARCSHVAEPHEAKCTHVDTYMVQTVFRLAGDGPTS